MATPEQVERILAAWAQYEYGGTPDRVMPSAYVSARGDASGGPLPLVQHQIVRAAIGAPSGELKRLCVHVWYHGRPLDELHLAPGRQVAWLGMSWADVRETMARHVRRRVRLALTPDALARIEQQDNPLKIA